MSAYELVGLAGLVVGALLAAARLPAVWRNEIGLNPNRVPAAWPFGAAMWHGYVRGLPVLCALFPLGLPIALINRFGGETLNEVVLPPFAFGILAAMLLCATIVFFNRPRFLVPPHLRAQPGALDEWTGAHVPPVPPPGQRPDWIRRKSDLVDS